MKNNTYKIDFVNNTLTMSKAFEDALNNPNSQEYKLFLQLRADFPGLTIIRKTRRAPKKARPNKNLTYKHMEQYMSVFENADELLAQFEVVKKCSLGQLCWIGSRTSSPSTRSCPTSATMPPR